MLGVFFSSHLPQERVRKGSCLCTTVSSFFSNTVDVRPMVGCRDFFDEGENWCYVVSTCPYSTPSVSFQGASWSVCSPLPPPPPAPLSCSEDPLEPYLWHHRRSNLLKGWGEVAPSLPGEGVTVVVVDDGVEVVHPDIGAREGDLHFSWNSSGERNPHYRPTFPHGTACAGIIHSVANNAKGGCGVAYAATLLSANLLGHGLGIYDKAEADVIETYMNVADVFSNSWGPPDNLKEARMGEMTRFALGELARRGRGGKGGISVFAGGNGGPSDNGNSDPYCSSEFTICVGAIGDDDKSTYFSEPSASLLVVAPSGGGVDAITTTDLMDERGYSPLNYSSTFSGTSASTPIVAGVVALVLQKKPSLGWRDVNTILAYSARRNDPLHPSWRRNAAGRWVSESYGFGAVDAYSAVRLAEEWTGVGEAYYLNASNVSSCPTPCSLHLLIEENATVETAILEFYVNHSWRGHVRVRIFSPSGTTSLLTSRFDAMPLPASREDAFSFPLSTSSNMFLDENSEGEWRVEADVLEGEEVGVLQYADLRLRVRNSSISVSTQTLHVLEGTPVVVESRTFPSPPPPLQEDVFRSPPTHPPSFPPSLPPRSPPLSPPLSPPNLFSPTYVVAASLSLSVVSLGTALYAERRRRRD